YEMKIKGTAFVFYCIKLGFIFLLLTGVGYMNMYTVSVKEKIVIQLELDGDEKSAGTISGVISDIRQGTTGYKVYVNCNMIEAETISGNMVYRGNVKTCVYMQNVDELKIGQHVVIMGDISCPSSPTNPGQFNEKEYYRNRGVYFLVYDGIILENGSSYNHIKQSLYMLRNKTSDIIESAFSSYAGGIVRAMLLGDKTDIDKDTKQLYRINGIAHILAISGLHIALLGMNLFRKLRKCIGSYWISGIVSVAVIIMYGIVTGFSVSTVRAIIMLVIDIAGMVIGRSSDMLTSMGLACVVLCIMNPYIIKDAGFLLSFGAIYGIAVVFPMLKSIAGRLAEKRIISAVILSLSINLVTTPIIIYFYYEFPLYGILINLIVVPCVEIILVMSIISITTGFFFISFARFAAFPVKCILLFYNVICRLFESFPYSSINVGHIEVWIIVFYYIWLMALLCGIVLLKSWCRENVKYRNSNKHTCDTEALQGNSTGIWLKIVFGVLFSIIASIVFIICAFRYFNPRFRMVFLDVGQGDGILISTEMGTNILIDGGSSSNDKLGEYIILPAIKYYGMSSLDYVFVSHGDEDHISGIKYLISTDHLGVTIENLVIAEYAYKDSLNELISMAEEKGINVISIKAGDVFEEGVNKEWISGEKENDDKGFSISCLYPSSLSTAENANDLSLVLKLETDNMSALFTGDIGLGAEQELMEKNCNLDCDILKVAHHGSKYSTGEAFISACTPDYAVISCGAYNFYGHPHKETLDRLEDVDVDLYRTDESGAIELMMTNHQVQIYTYGDR
ncbi:MAG: DNA internalization-related competence protein ComEC/Rec2, partial [Coprococcus sp.]